MALEDCQTGVFISKAMLKNVEDPEGLVMNYFSSIGKEIYGRIKDTETSLRVRVTVSFER